MNARGARATPQHTPQPQNDDVLLEIIGKAALNPQYAHTIIKLPIGDSILMAELAIETVKRHRYYCIFDDPYQSLPPQLPLGGEDTESSDSWTNSGSGNEGGFKEKSMNKTKKCYENHIFWRGIQPQLAMLEKEVQSARLEENAIKNRYPRDLSFNLDVNKALDQVTGFFEGIFHAPSVRKLKEGQALLLRGYNNTLAIQRKMNHAMVVLTNRIFHVNEIADHNSVVGEILLNEQFKIKFLLAGTTMIQGSLDLMTLVHLSVSEIAQNRVPASLYNLAEADNTLHVLNKYAIENGLESIAKNPLDIYRARASTFVHADGSWVVIPHLPLIPVKSLITLYKYHAFPISAKNTSIVPDVKDKLVFAATIDLVDDITHAEVDLNDCYPLSSTQVCERVVLWTGVRHTRSESTCMASLLNGLKSGCSFKELAAQSWGPRAVGNKLYYYSPTADQAMLVNNTAETRLDIVKGRNRINLSSGLTVTTKNWLFRASEVNTLDVGTSWYKVDMDMVDFGYVQNDIHDIRLESSKDLEELKAALDDWKDAVDDTNADIVYDLEANEADLERVAQELANAQEAGSWLLIAVCCVGGFALFTVLAFICCWISNCVRHATSLPGP